MIKATLEAASYEVLCASHGIEGLEVLKTEAVDLIISDLNMINMGGFEFLDRLREQPEHQFTPFLFLTTEDSDEFRDMGRDAGATGWLCKPFDPAELIKVVRRIVH